MRCTASSRRIALSGAKRGAVLFVLWWIMGGGEGLVAGLAAAGLAAWVSISLAPPQQAVFAIRPLALARLVARFLWGSLVGGADVARRAFSPGMPLQLGMSAYRPVLPPGPSRNLFMSVASLMPGALYTATDESGALLFHCLDVAEPVLAQLADEEARVAAALGIDTALLQDAGLPADRGGASA